MFLQPIGGTDNSNDANEGLRCQQVSYDDLSRTTSGYGGDSLEFQNSIKVSVLDLEHHCFPLPAATVTSALE